LSLVVVEVGISDVDETSVTVVPTEAGNTVVPTRPVGVAGVVVGVASVTVVVFCFADGVPGVTFVGTTVTVVVAGVTDSVLDASFVCTGVNVVADGLTDDNSSVTVTVGVCSDGCIMVVVFSTDAVYVSVWDCKVLFSSKEVLLKLIVVVFSSAEPVTTEW